MGYIYLPRILVFPFPSVCFSVKIYLCNMKCYCMTMTGCFLANHVTKQVSVCLELHISSTQWFHCICDFSTMDFCFCLFHRSRFIPSNIFIDIISN